MSLGVTKNEFMDSTPNELKCYIEAERLSVKRKDEEQWRMGMYNLSAFSTALSRALNGNKSRAKYAEEPFFEKVTETKDEENLTEEQIKEERSKLLAALMTWQANFELNHSGGGEK